jgi:hypothetical protein
LLGFLDEESELVIPSRIFVAIKKLVATKQTVNTIAMFLLKLTIMIPTRKKKATALKLFAIKYPKLVVALKNTIT